MTLFQQLLLYGFTILAGLLLADAALYLWYNSGNRASTRIKKRLGRKNIVTSYRESMIRKKQDYDSNVFFLHRYFSDLIQQADSGMELKRLYFRMALLSAVMFLLFKIFISFFMALFLAVGVGILAPIALFKLQIQKRNARFEEQFPDAIDLVVRNLRIGRPLNAAIKSVAEEMSVPIGKEFHLVAHDITYGKNVSDAVKAMLKRIHVANLRFFVVAVQIQQESGGNLAEILDGLSKVIRGRFRLMRKVRALTAEGRFSAWFLSIFPIVMIFTMNFINPGYYEKVSDFPLFTALIIVTIVMLCMNVVAMRVITKLKL